MRLLIVAIAAFFLGATAAIFLGPMLKPAEKQKALPACPYLSESDVSALPPAVITTVGAYEAIRETLSRDSLDGVAAQADAIARAFETTSPEIAACAKRLGGEQDVESARRALMRLNRLLEKHAMTLPGA